MLYLIYFTTILAVVGTIIYLVNRRYRRNFIPDFKNKYVLITGTDSGFGHKLAIYLDSIGLHVFAGCYTKLGAEKLQKSSSDRLKTVPLDVTDEASIAKAKSFVEDNLPTGEQLWGLVNNAGIGGNFNFGLSTLEDYRETMEVNCFGSIRMVQAFEELIKKSKGRIVQVISIFGRGSVMAPPYSCSKFAIQPYTDELRRFMREYGVKVCTIEPGSFSQTSIFDPLIWQGILRKKFEALPVRKKEEFGEDYVENEINKINGFLSKYRPFDKLNSMKMVTDAISHGLGAKHPKSRYLVGYDARPFVLMVTCAPDWLLDAGIAIVLWLSNKHFKFWK